MQKSTRQLQDFVGPAQLLDLALQLLHGLRLCGRNAVAHARIDLHALYPFIERAVARSQFWGATDSMAAHSEGYSPRCSRTMRTARSRT